MRDARGPIYSEKLVNKEEQAFNLLFLQMYLGVKNRQRRKVPFKEEFWPASVEKVKELKCAKLQTASNRLAVTLRNLLGHRRKLLVGSCASSKEVGHARGPHGSQKSN